MKRHILSMILMGLMIPAIAQQYNTPTVFHNQWERMQYQCTHPELLPMQVNGSRSVTDFTQKLDSVVGSDDFDRIRWKDVYTYSEGGKVEIAYTWEEQLWQPSLKTETTVEDDDELALVSRWRNEAWEPYQRVRYQYLDTPSGRLLEEVLTEASEDTAWVGVNYTVYEYDDQGRILCYTYYNGLNGLGEWRPYNKREYTYNEDGQLVFRLLYNSRNGDWRESQKDTLFYDENQRCVEMMSYRKGGWGPGANQWMESEKYEITYTADGQVESETNYTAGWFSSEMTMEGKTGYTFDAQGNLLMKTMSVFNEEDWVVRDVYENIFNPSVNANEVLGMTELWVANLDNGMGYVLGQDMPLINGWKSCSIASSYLDTQFALYCSGFQSVGEQQVTALKAWADQGRLTVVSPHPVEISVFDLTGRLVVSRSNETSGTFDLKPGLYLVRGGNEVVKVMVR